jgi:NADH-quinone oxidoreductase subunit N
MYFDEPAKAFDQAGIAARVVLALSTALVIFYALAPAPLTDAAMAAAKSLF